VARVGGLPSIKEPRTRDPPLPSGHSPIEVQSEMMAGAILERARVLKRVGVRETKRVVVARLDLHAVSRYPS